MDMKRGRGKSNKGNGGQRNPSMQDMALASQLGLAGLFDPSMLGATGMMPAGLDTQQLLAGAGAMPMMDPTAMAALGAMGALPPGGFPPGFLPGNAATDWLAMAQQAQLLAAMGGAVPPAFLPQLNAVNAFGSLGEKNGPSSSKQTSSNSSKRNSGSSSAHRKSPSVSPAQGYKNSWMNNNSSSSRNLPNHSSPRPHTPSRQSRKIKSPNMNSSETVSKVISNQYEALAQKQAQTEQIMQAELLRQFEQQFILQQMQLQQQQEQIQAALQVLNKKQTKSPQSSQRSTSSHHHNSSSSNNFQDYMSLNSLQPSQANIEALMALGQIPQASVQQTSNRSRPSSSHDGATLNSRSSSQNKEFKSTNKSMTGGLDHQIAKAIDSDPAAFMAALYSQMQQQDPNARHSPAFSNPSGQEKTLAKPTENRSRRKQPNPTSVASSLQRQAASSPLEGNTSRDLSQTSPLPLVKARQTPERSEARKSASPVRLVKQFPQRKQQSSPGVGAEKIKATLSTTAAKFNNLFTGMPQPDVGQPSQEDMNKLMLEAYGEMLVNSGGGGDGKQGDLNKINELLTATVAAEMHRLQMEQLNLARELENLSNGKDPGKTEKTNRVSVIHKAETSRFGESSRDREPMEDKQTRKDRGPVINESELKEPLQVGWSREVRFTGDAENFKSDVTYFSPDGKKFTSLDDIVQHLAETTETKYDKQHFSFATNIKIGSFYHRPHDEDSFDNERKLDPLQAEKFFSKLDEEVYDSDGSELDDKAGKGADDGWKGNPQDAKKLLEERCFKEAGQKAMKQAVELKMQQKNEQRRLAKILRQKERQQKLEQQKLEREMRERQMIEERQKMEAARQLKYQEALRKAKERELQRQQQLLFKQQERERRRQHLILLKNIETKRRAAERDKRREEIRNEKIYIRERKLEQRRRAMKLARELKMPVEDMKLKNLRPLPKMENLQGTICDKENSDRWTQLSGNATADVLMVLEFLLTFKDAILLDESVIPTCEQLQRGLLNDPEHTGSLVQLTMALLHQCLCDPGVPAPGPWLHCATGVKVTDIDVSKSNYSEILRLFLWARHGHKSEITDCLETEPFLSLSGDRKAEILAFLVNELVCSQPVCSEIERHLENLATLRRDKWVVEGKIRQARVEHANDESDASANSPFKSRAKMRQPISGETEVKDEKDSVKGDDDSNQSSNENKVKNETPMEKKMKKLTQEHQSFNEKMFMSSKPLRALDLGQDRYKRRYWVLSNVGGIYVEGLESGCWLDDEAEMIEVTEGRKSEVQEGCDSKPDVENMEIKCETLADEPEKPSVKTENVDQEMAVVENKPQPHETPVNAVKTETPVLQNGPVQGVGENPLGNSPDTKPALTNEPTLKITENRPASFADVNGITPCDVKVSPRRDSDVTNKEAKRDVEEDSVVAAAKAIAARAVASSSHILYPNQNRHVQQSPDCSLQAVTSSERVPLVASSTPTNHDLQTKTTGAGRCDQDFNRSEIGKLTALTLQSIGVDPSKLSQAQMEALTRISAPNQDRQVTDPQEVLVQECSKLSQATKNHSTAEGAEENSQNAPIDLSRPSAPFYRPQTEPTAPTNSHNQFNSILHPAQAALAFGGLPPGVFDGAMGFKNEGVNAELFAAVRQEFGSEEGFEMGLRWRAEDQYDEPKPIPKDAKYGWWKICEEKVLEDLTESLHSRGIREKHLTRSVAKYRNYCSDAMLEAKKPENQFSNGPIPEAVKDEKPENEKDEATEKEESMEVDEPIPTRSKRKAPVESEDILENPEETAFQIEMETLKQVEELSDRCVAVGILNKAWSTTPKASLNRMDLAHVPLSRDHDPNVKHDCSNPVQHDPRSVMHAAVELVRKLELALSRLYLKPPLIRKGGATEFSNLPSLSDSGMNDVAAGLRTWRNAVSSATSASQLSMCVTMLESCIAWEKTPMSSTRSDASPRPKKRRQPPKTSTTPSGGGGGGSAAKKKKITYKNVDHPGTPDPIYSDESSHHGGRISVDNADALKSTDKAKDGGGPSAFTNDLTHGDDVERYDDEDGELPFSGMAYNDESIHACDFGSHGSQELGSEAKKKKKKSKKKNKDKDKEREKEKGEKSAKRKKSHTTFCREMLRELQSHDSANWFLYPVDLNEVPDYKKIIKKPIDFSTIENRLRKGRYKTHEMFSTEVRTVFDNCRIYNEDESAIGRAGHDLREFFDRRWAEILESNRDLIEASQLTEDLEAS